MELMPTTFMEKLDLPLAIEALKEFLSIVEARGGIGLEFLLCNGRDKILAKFTLKDTGWERMVE